jgi:DNA helicase IV
MQWRMLARRCPSGSMTIVGDFGQASKPGSARGWDDVLALLPDRSTPHVLSLSVNYRTPAEIMDVAHRVLAAAAPDIEATRAVRRTGEFPSFERVDPMELVECAAQAARVAVGDEGTVAIVAPADVHLALVEALADIGAVARSADALDAAVAILDARDAKGLEFDHVVVVEPARLVTPDALGLRLLYVVLTRATRRLVIVHAEPLPEALEPATAGSRSGAPASSAVGSS